VATYRVNAGYLPLNHWTQDPDQGGGRIIGEAVHFVDFLTYLVGDAPVDASIRSLPDGGRYKGDNAVIQLSFLDGSLGVVTYVANGDKSFPKERVEVFGGGRTAALDDFRSLEMVRDGRRQVVKSQLKQDKGHAQEVQAFVSSVISGGSPPIAYQQLFGVHRVLLEALNESR
jgi:predicted dehydrogenase